MEGLIGNSFYEHTARAASDGLLTISPGHLRPKYRQYLRGIVSETDALLGLKIKIVDSTKADVVFHTVDRTKVFAAVGEHGATGFARQRPRGQWDILIQHGLRHNFTKRLLWHELGHVLGMEHPFDDSDGDYIQSTNPWHSLTTNQSLMAYRRGSRSRYHWRRLDKETLTDLWGR